MWVENDDITLTGFINPEQYTKAEYWKLHMADLFEYTAEPLKSQLLALNERDAEPRWGKIDYDIDGKLIGTWFKQGTNGYAGLQHGSEGYWNGHLSIVPDGNDPTQVIVSIGDFNGQAEQFAVIGNTPDPATVSTNTGLVKYELGQIVYYSGDTGKVWDRLTYLPHLRTKASDFAAGTILVQLISPRVLQVEVFPDKTAAQTSTFTTNANLYER